MIKRFEEEKFKLEEEIEILKNIRQPSVRLNKN